MRRKNKTKQQNKCKRNTKNKRLEAMTGISVVSLHECIPRLPTGPQIAGFLVHSDRSVEGSDQPTILYCCYG